MPGLYSGVGGGDVEVSICSKVIPLGSLIMIAVLRFKFYYLDIIN